MIFVGWIDGMMNLLSWFGFIVDNIGELGEVKWFYFGIVVVCDIELDWEIFVWGSIYLWLIVSLCYLFVMLSCVFR